MRRRANAYQRVAGRASATGPGPAAAAASGRRGAAAAVGPCAAASLEPRRRGRGRRGRGARAALRDGCWRGLLLARWRRVVRRARARRPRRPRTARGRAPATASRAARLAGAAALAAPAADGGAASAATRRAARSTPAATTRGAARRGLVPASTCRPATRAHRRALSGHLPAAWQRTDRRPRSCDIGLQGELDRLIARHAIPPTDRRHGPGRRRARTTGATTATTRYESYVLEVQRLVDRMLPTIAHARRARDRRLLDGRLRRDAPGADTRTASASSRAGSASSTVWTASCAPPARRSHALGLRAFVYGGASDDIADPSENAPFAAALRAAGADAHSAVYPGEHGMETLEAHLPRC